MPGFPEGSVRAESEAHRDAVAEKREIFAALAQEPPKERVVLLQAIFNESLQDGLEAVRFLALSPDDFSDIFLDDTFLNAHADFMQKVMKRAVASDSISDWDKRAAAQWHSGFLNRFSTPTASSRSRSRLKAQSPSAKALERRISAYYAPFRKSRGEKGINIKKDRQRIKPQKTPEGLQERIPKTGSELADEYLEEVLVAHEKHYYAADIRGLIMRQIMDNPVSLLREDLQSNYNNDARLQEEYGSARSYISAVRKGHEYTDLSLFPKDFFQKDSQDLIFKILNGETMTEREAFIVLNACQLDPEELKLERYQAKPLAMHMEVLRDKAAAKLEEEIVEELAAKGYEPDRLAIEVGTDNLLHVYEYPEGWDQENAERADGSFVFDVKSAERKEIRFGENAIPKEVHAKEGKLFGTMQMDADRDVGFFQDLESEEWKTYAAGQEVKDVNEGLPLIFDKTNNRILIGGDFYNLYPHDSIIDNLKYLGGKVSHTVKTDQGDILIHNGEQVSDLGQAFESVDDLTKIGEILVFKGIRRAPPPGQERDCICFLFPPGKGREEIPVSDDARIETVHQGNLIYTKRFKMADGTNVWGVCTYGLRSERVQDIKHLDYRPRKVISAGSELWAVLHEGDSEDIRDIESGRRVFPPVFRIHDVEVTDDCVRVAVYLNENDKDNHKITVLTHPFTKTTEKKAVADEKKEVPLRSKDVVALLAKLNVIEVSFDRNLVMAMTLSERERRVKLPKNEKKMSVEDSAGMAARLSRALEKDEKGVFSKTVPAKADPTDPETIQCVAEILFPSIRSNQEHPVVDNVEEPVRPSRVDFFRDLERTSPRDGDPREKKSPELLHFREPWRKNVFVRGIYGHFDAATRQWNAIHVPCEVETGLETSVRTFTIPDAEKFAGEIKLLLPLGAKVIEDRVVGTREAKTQEPVPVRIDAVGQAFIDLPKKHGYTTINYSVECPESLPSLSSVSERELTTFKEQLRKNEFGDLEKPLARLPPECELLLSQIKDLQPDERIKRIEAYVREVTYYDFDITESTTLSSILPDEDIQKMRQRLEEIRAAHPERAEQLRGKLFAGVCRGANLVTLAMLRKAGIPSGMMLVLAPREGAQSVVVKDRHAMCFTLLPSERGGICLVPVDGTPSGTTPEEQQLIANFQLPSTEQRDASRNEEESRMMERAAAEMTRVEEMVLAKRPQDLHALDNGKLEATLNSVLDNAVKHSHVEALHALLNAARYSPFKFTEIDFDRPDQARAYIEFLRTQIETARRSQAKDQPAMRQAGVRLFRLIGEFENRYAADADIRHRRSALVVLRLLLRLTAQAVPPLMEPMEQRAAELVVNYLAAKRVGT